MDRPLQRVGGDDRPGLPGEEVDRVRRVVPEQVVGPGPRLAERVDVAAPEEEGLDDHLLDRELARDDAAMDPLVARIEAARVADHRDQPGLLLRALDGEGAVEAVGKRDLDLDVLARAQALLRLAAWSCVGVARITASTSGRARLSPELRGDVRDAELARHLLGRLARPSDERGHGHAVDLRERFEVLDAERAGAGEADLHRGFSKMMWPTAVFDAGTW